MCEHGSGDSNSSPVFTPLDIPGQYVLELRSPGALNRPRSSISGQRVNKKENKDHFGATEMFWTTGWGCVVLITAFHQGVVKTPRFRGRPRGQYASRGRWFFYFLRVVHKVNKDVRATVHVLWMRWRPSDRLLVWL